MDDYSAKQWCTIDVTFNCREQLKAYKTKYKFTSYSAALENLIAKGIPNKKHRTPPFNRVNKNYYFKVWEGTWSKLVKICNAVLTLLEHDKGE